MKKPPEILVPKIATKVGPPLPWKEFLISISPGSQSAVLGLLERATPESWRLSAPDLLLYCTSPQCDGLRVFGGKADSKYLDLAKWNHRFLIYRCKNCERTEKFFSVLFRRKVKNSEDGEAIKVGEWPPFGPPVPSEILGLIGPEQDTFVKGRRAETQDLGLGAFAYYCRVLERQNTRIFQQIVETAERLGTPDQILELMQPATQQPTFSEAVRALGDRLPPALFIRGVNPVELLERALTENVAQKSDKELLRIAKSIRVILSELAERIDQILKERSELNQAIDILTADLDESQEPV